MATTPPGLLLTDEQRLALDQFEFYAIQERRGTPVLRVGSAMRSGSSSGSDSSSSSTASSSRRSSCATSPPSHFASAASSKAVVSDSALADRATHCDSTALCRGGNALPLTGARCEPLQRMCPERSRSIMDSQVPELEVPTPPSLHVIAAVPLLHDHDSAGKGDVASSAAGVSASSRRPRRGLRASAASGSAVPLEALVRHGDAGALDGAPQASVGERCEELAERLVRLSAQADAATFAMDRRVVPPLEFC
ncbi:hypothetical protein LSCM4_02951 [Leishmania orientalis]|uniref:Uncharacterized protein n=1 Tax=Leishmania orientalis TaxID=2249476 RepID=A0A836KDW1_9TRYP|nr:hypothetical protein LSCM4_02951 [Leishmania orientalis]